MKRSADLGYIVPQTVFVGEEEGLLYLFLFSLSLSVQTPNEEDSPPSIHTCLFIRVFNAVSVRI